MSMQTRKQIGIAGTLQRRVLVTLTEGASSGVELLKKLDLKSPGTIYPVLKSLLMEGFIEYAPVKVPGKKMYVLSETGKEQLKTILLGISRGFFGDYMEPHTHSLVDVLENLIKLKPQQKVLCTLDYEPIKQWMQKAEVTYLTTPDLPRGVYDLIFCTMVGSLILYGWERDEFTLYFSKLVKSLHPGGTLLMVEIEKTDNVFAGIFFKDVLGYGKVPGISQEELKDLLEHYHLNIRKLLNWRGLLIGISTV